MNLLASGRTGKRMGGLGKPAWADHPTIIAMEQAA
jgi:hypothetical protein